MNLRTGSRHPQSSRTDEEFSLELDAADPLASFRERFELPVSPNGEQRIYFLGNSLGPLPKGVRGVVDAELDAWARRGVESYFQGISEWAGLDVVHRERMAVIVGAQADEIAVMNGLSANLHFLLASFYQPAADRRRILVERSGFPSDRHVVETHLSWHGIEPAEGLLEVGGGGSPAGSTTETVVRALREHGEQVAVVFLGGVNYATGELLDIGRIAEAGREAGCRVGFDLAHAAGNVPLSLHDWDVDFAAWCTYKYLNCGPGGPAAIFVHERHSMDTSKFRLGGWWGTDPAVRFRWAPDEPFEPRPGAVGWQLSCPSVLSFAPLGPSLELFAEAGMQRIRQKSVRLTAYLERLVETFAGSRANFITPGDPDARGAQLSLRVPGARGLQEALAGDGLDTDVREPDILRLAPAPLFNTYHEVWRAAWLIAARLNEGGDPGG